MGYTQPWHSSHGVDPSVFDRDFGRIVCFLRDGDRVFLTYGSTGRGVEAIMSSLKLLDITVYGRQEVWEDSPEGWPQRPTYSFWRRDGRPIAQWTRPGATPVPAPGQHCH